MKKLIKKVILFLLPICTFLAVYEVMTRHIENDYIYKNKWLTDNCNSINLLSLGSSHCLYGINPSFLSLRSFNAGHNAQSIYYDYLLFNKFFNQMDSLQYLVVTISYGDPYYNMEDWPSSFGKFVKNYTLYYHFPSSKIKDYFEFLSGFDFATIYNYIIHNSPHRECLELGWAPHVSNKRNWMNEDTAIIQDAYPEQLVYKLGNKRYNQNMDYMESIINKCRTKNVQVILLTTPIHKLFRDNNTDNDIWAITTGFCHHLVQEFDNVSYINLFQDSRFEDGDFWDANHLNTCGAQKLSLILNDYITAMSR